MEYCTVFKKNGGIKFERKTTSLLSYCTLLYYNVRKHIPTYVRTYVKERKTG